MVHTFKDLDGIFYAQDAAKACKSFLRIVLFSNEIKRTSKFQYKEQGQKNKMALNSLAGKLNRI